MKCFMWTLNNYIYFLFFFFLNSCLLKILCHINKSKNRMVYYRINKNYLTIWTPLIFSTRILKKKEHNIKQFVSKSNCSALRLERKNGNTIYVLLRIATGIFFSDFFNCKVFIIFFIFYSCFNWIDWFYSHYY